MPPMLLGKSRPHNSIGYQQEIHGTPRGGVELRSPLVDSYHNIVRPRWMLRCRRIARASPVMS